MWNDTSKLLVAFLILAFATGGISLHTNRFLENLNESLRIWLLAPIGFSALFILTVLLRLAEPFTQFPLAPCFLVLSAAYGLFRSLKLGLKNQLCFVKNTWFIVCPYFGFSIIYLYLKGGLPFSVTDTWTHTSYVNRISSSDSALILGSHLPTDGKFFSFSPTSIFLASVNDVVFNDPIAVWNASAIFFGLLVLCASTSFLISLNPLSLVSRNLLMAVSVLFVVLYPTADLVIGWAGYSMTGSIYLFVVLALTVHCSAHRNSNSLVSILALIGFVMSTNHQIESVTGLLMMIPLLVVPSISRKRLIRIIVLFSLVSAVGGLLTTRLLNPEILVVFDFSGVWPGFGFFMNAVNPFLNGRLLISVVVSLLYLFITGRRLIVAYFAASLVTIALCGPWNPIVHYLWVELMSATLMYRAIFALPIWILYGGFIACFVTDIHKIRYVSRQEILFRLFAFVLVVVPIGMHASEKFGLTGQMTYYGADNQSQLSTLPDLYEEIQGYDKKVVLTDTWTGAPIPTISSSYIVVHRPWTSGPDMNRFALGREVMNSLATIQSHSMLCKWGVDIVLLNRAQLPLMKRQFEAAPWLLPDFYNGPNVLLPGYLEEIAVINNVHVIEFDKATCAS